MSDFEGQIWATQNNDEVDFVCTVKRVKNKIQALNNKNREQRIAEDKLLWKHPSQARDKSDWETKIESIENNITNLKSDIDVEFLWESALELEISEIQDLVDVYYGDNVTAENFVSIWRVMAEDKLYFKRKGKVWEARTAEQIEELKLQREREERRQQEETQAREWLQKLLKAESPPFFAGAAPEQKFKPQAVPEALESFAERLEAWLRGDKDKMVSEIVSSIAESNRLSSRELVVDSLQKVGRIPVDVDRDILIAGLKLDFSTGVTDAANEVQPWVAPEGTDCTQVAFSIDDESTKEVDDALDIERDGDAWKVTIAVADPECVVHRNDTLDREAMRRGTTVYLPTQTILMMPPRVSCDIASLSAQQPRSSIVIRAWIDDNGEVINSSIGRETITVQERLDYIGSDQMIENGEGATAEKLKQLHQVAQKLRAKRIADGALMLQRPEYRIQVHNDHIAVEMVEFNSASHKLVAEMMILGNHLAAKYAQLNQVPIIYRVQEPPEKPIDEEMMSSPLAFQKVRKLIKASSLSLQPSGHSGLGLSAYTQLTSPLRRFADLVMQRQLVAHVVGEELPYDQDELFKVLATAERTAKDARKLENESKKRWFAQYLKQNMQNQPIETLVLEEVKGGYKAEMYPWGVDAFLATPKKLTVGTKVTALTDKIRVKAANIRLKLA
ncbi:ribonuclease catalytic domain-containing protein [Candidatus Albibeggiatoa sp. nov. NOAA]|uniref:ribonuclease catalytic domain-containing protein n=1 Tax=Candidatus Albibeggiatoa sp. nov. NOAA TaxID=3162724 RepID=UPI003304076A|nr:ribonuclease catalytic domain-containing protein [Thiotrichaceae bacterium]